MNCDVYKLCDKKSKNIKNIKIEKESKLNLFLMAELYFEWIIMINLSKILYTEMANSCPQSALSQSYKILSRILQ